MLFYVAELSKYIITFMLLIYLFECGLYVFKMNNPYDCNGIYIRQRIIIFMINALAFTTMCLRSGKYEYIFYGGAIILILFFGMALTILIYPRLDQLLMNNMILLLDIGFIILTRLSYNRALKQFGIVVVSLALALAVPMLIKKIDAIKNLGIIYATLGIVALSVVLLLGKITKGAKLAYTVGGITIQPSEFVKIIFVLCVAAFLSKAKTFLDYCIISCIAALHVIVLVLSKDLGSALIFFVAYLIMLFNSIISKRFKGLPAKTSPFLFNLINKVSPLLGQYLASYGK